MSNMRISTQKGQVLAEVLIAVVIAGIVIGGIASTIGTSLITSKRTKQITAATALAQEDTEAIKSIASSNWLTVYCPPADSGCGNKGSGYPYSIVLPESDRTWHVQSGEATSTPDAGGVVYTHYFYLDNVNRGGDGGIVGSGGTEDPSTQKATVVVTWSGESETNPFTMSEYLMRVTSASFRDFNWSFIDDQGTYTYSQGAYSTSSNIAIPSSSIELQEHTLDGSLISSTFDTGVAAGAAFNSIMWKGEKSSNSSVRFRFASSNSSTGPWTFIGSDGTDASYYGSSSPNVAIPITTFYHNNHQYFRYKIYLHPSDDNQSPTVTDVIIGYSP
jgi:type II secretory pathway pseudopilin PulG